MVYTSGVETHEIIGAAMAVHRELGCGFVIVELKAVKEIENIFRAQAMNYAKVAGCKIALLLNFGETSLKYERYNIQQNP